MTHRYLQIYEQSSDQVKVCIYHRQRTIVGEVRTLFRPQQGTRMLGKKKKTSGEGRDELYLTVAGWFGVQESSDG